MFKVAIEPKAYRIIKKLKGQKLKEFESVVEKLKNDPFSPSLKTHKLKGDLKDIYSCKLDFSNRVLFMIFSSDSLLTIVDIGSHDEVY